MIESDYGFQSSEVSRAVQLIRTSIRDKHKVILAFTGNMISSGLRNSICKLTKSSALSALVTNGAGVEEDIIKTFGNYKNIEFRSTARELIAKKLYRIGNLAVHYDLYDKLWDFLERNYDRIISDKNCDQSPGEIAKSMGNVTKNHESYLYWAFKKKIDVYCPTFHDGAIGDFLMEHREKNIDYRIDYVLENVKLSRALKSYQKCGIIILGGGTSKHFALNNSILRGGYDWSIIISTAIPYDGSDSGGDAEEARSWGKIKPDAPSVNIFSDATLVFPTLVTQGFNLI